MKKSSTPSTRIKPRNLTKGDISRFQTDGVRKPQNAKRPCTQCGTNHRHNNAFCSAVCCETYKSVKKAEYHEKRLSRKFDKLCDEGYDRAMKRAIRA